MGRPADKSAIPSIVSLTVSFIASLGSAAFVAYASSSFAIGGTSAAVVVLVWIVLALRSYTLRNTKIPS
jgi:hypothetical protein